MHFLDTGVSKLSTDPRKIIMRFIKESVVHYIRWTNPQADDAYTPEEIRDRALQKQTPYTASAALKQPNIPNNPSRQRPQAFEYLNNDKGAKA